MKKSLVVVAALAMAGFAIPAYAQSDTLTVDVSASVPEQCSFAEPNIAAKLSNDRPVYQTKVGFSCNFDGAVSTKITSQNGELVSENGDKASYTIFFDDSTPTPSNSWSSARDFAPGGIGYGIDTGLLQSGDAGQLQSANIGFALVAPIKVAGLYTDVITITLTP